ncbi:MAG: bifunctional aldolase/short-chain dehydrogenase [Desulfobulbaceae bacterium]|nr:MAG: bifunctional aldolase/short-chain dehydrogenase [Desulfobulbaceae bacterium]
MKNRYNPEEAQKFIERYGDFPPEMGLRVYTSRLIGQEEDLVLHGGGNTSAKASMTNIVGDEVRVIFVKGSGWDLADMEPAGLPGLELAPLRRLRSLAELSDEEMVNQFRTNLLDASAPNPSIETLVHAFLPHTFIDHTHADAIVTLTNQANAEALLKMALGDKVGILPFIMPGFPLAKAVIDLYERQPDMECLILRNHGIFTFADDARTAYERMISYVSRAEEFIAAKIKERPLPPPDSAECPDTDIILPLLRGALSCTEADGFQRLFHLHIRSTPEIITAVNQPDSHRLYGGGVLTPDHVIRTKNYPLFLDFTDMISEEEMADHIKTEISSYVAAYEAYFSEQVAAKKVERRRLDPMPRLILVKGLGIISVGKNIKDTIIAADIAEHTLAAKSAAASVGCYRQLDPSSIFDMEYWGLEQAKLGKKKPLPLEGKIALVTGGGGAIAVGICRKLLAAGARVFLADIDAERLQKVRDILKGEGSATMVRAVTMDVADADSVRQAYAKIILEAGGLDILVPNAGIAHVARLEELDSTIFHKVLDVNLGGVFEVIKAAIPLFRRQATGGNIIINSSKNVFAPGASFGAYSASKAGAHQIGKIAALELAELGVRVNMINADAIFNAGQVSSGLWDVVGPDRMKSRNLDPQGLKEYYHQRNLLKTEVLAEHVGNGVVFFASNQTPTTGATLPIDGGIMAAFPR